MIATIFVVIGHSAYLNITSLYGGIAYTLPEGLSTVYNLGTITGIRQMAEWISKFHMPLFFMLSGAVLALRPMKSFDYLLKSKFRRLLFPYYVWGWCFMIPVKKVGDFYSNDTVFAAMRGFLSGEEGSHLWFLPALFWCMIVFCALYKLLEKWHVKSGYALLLITAVVQITVWEFLPFDILCLKTGLNYIFYFELGYQFEHERRAHERWNMRMTLFAIVILWMIEVLNNHFAILNSFFTIIAGAFFTYLIADICTRVFTKATDSLLWKVVVKNLFYVYIFHDPMEYIILKISMDHYWLCSDIGCVIYIISRTVLVFVLGVLFGEIVSKCKNSLSGVLAGECSENLDNL